MWESQNPPGVYVHENDLPLPLGHLPERTTQTRIGSIDIFQQMNPHLYAKALAAVNNVFPDNPTQRKVVLGLLAGVHYHMFMTEWDIGDRATSPPIENEIGSLMTRFNSAEDLGHSPTFPEAA